MRQAQLRAGASLPASPQLGAGKAVVEKGQQRALAARDKEQAKREKERRRIVEQARPLPYTKKVEIDEFLGNLVRGPPPRLVPSLCALPDFGLLSAPAARQGQEDAPARVEGRLVARRVGRPQRRLGAQDRACHGGRQRLA